MMVTTSMPECPDCRASAALLLRARDLNMRIDDADFDYYRCSRCRLVFLSPIPSDLSRYYGGDYPPYAVPRSIDELGGAVGQVRWRVEFLQRHVSGGRLVEIGPSFGAFSHVAAQSGFSVDAIEMSETCCNFIRQHLPEVHVVQTDDVAAALQQLSGQYQAIAMWHNLEHLVDRRNTLARAVERLESGGILVISTPNPDSFQFRLLGRHWVHLDAPRHVALIPRAALQAQLAALGMRLEEMTTTDPDGVMLNQMGWDASLNYATDAMAAVGSLRRYWYRKRLKLVRDCLKPVERLRQNGAAYTAVFRKCA